MNNGIQPAATALAKSVLPSGRRPDPFFLRLVKFWIWLAALAGLAGWTLSALGQLNRLGYSFFFAAAAGVYFTFHRRFEWQRPNWGKYFRRFHRPLPGAFAVLAMLVFAGSIIYPPTNYTGLTYHLARVLQWIAHGGWYWIHTPNQRMNFSGCAFEWLTTPLVLFTKSDRALFIVNFIPFLLLPALIFSLFTRLGIRPRVAWPWMWLLPAGYIFLLQAGSIANDAFATVFALAAVDFAARAWETRCARDLWISVLAAALVTGIKLTSLPLLLPWVILVAPLFRLFLRHWLSTSAVVALAAIASFLPIALLNYRHAGDWLGQSVEPVNLEVHNVLIGIAANAYQFLANNFIPPVFPFAGWWNQHVLTWVPPGLMAEINRNFGMGFHVVGEIPTEDTTGLGFGVSFLLLISLIGSIWSRRSDSYRSPATMIPSWFCRCVLAAAWVALLAFSMRSGLATGARLIAPYYPLLVPAILTVPGQTQIVRRRWWRMLAGVVMALAGLVLALSPDRPLWPAQTILSAVLVKHPGQPAAARALEVYSVYARRNDALAGVRTLLPPGCKVVGFIGDGDDYDTSLWRPFGSRRVYHFFLTDPPDLLRSQVEYVAVGEYSLKVNHMTIDEWLRTNHAELVATTNLLTTINEGWQNWYLARLNK